jgi:hypothetical protein
MGRRWQRLASIACAPACACALATAAVAQAPPAPAPQVTPRVERSDPDACASATFGLGGDVVESLPPEARPQNPDERPAQANRVVCPPPRPDPALRRPAPPQGEGPALRPPDATGRERQGPPQ